MPAMNLQIVCCFDESFEAGFVVMLESLLEHLSESETVSLFLLYHRLAPITLERLEAHLSDRGVAAQLLRIDPGPLAGVGTPGHLKVEAYFRLLIPSILPASVSRVLYLDCDLLITDDIRELWKLDLDDKLIALAHNWNSGVMLFNLEQWRKQGTGPMLINYAKEYPEKCPLADNSAIMAKIDAEDIHFFDVRWNTSHEAGPGHIGVVHFVGAIKPWHHFYSHPHHRAEFFRYLDRTPWAGWRPPRPTLRARALHLLRSVRGQSSLLRSLGDTKAGRLLARLVKRG